MTREDGALLLAQRDSGAVAAIAAVADELRRRRNGDAATYVVNRNIQFTNVCVKRCGFCAFSRTALPKNGAAGGPLGDAQEEGYFLPTAEVVRRAKEAADLGATEICVQAGLPPGMQPNLYEEIAIAIKEAVPQCHLHAFSPEEVLYGARVSRRTVPEMLRALREAGVDSLPGTSAEVLDDEVRRRLAAARLSVQEWRGVIEAAHAEGLPTTSTLMYGHVETPAQVAAHLDLLREVQARAVAHGGPGRITEFVPLSFVAAEAPMFRLGLLPGCRAGPGGVEVVLTHAVARIMLDGAVDNIQASWVKEGPRMAQVLLHAGVNDLGGTLINESISTAAGARYGQRLSPSELREIARGAGREPVERSTTYKVLRRFTHESGEQVGLEGPTEAVLESTSEANAWQGGDERFGSYGNLTTSSQWRFRAESSARRGLGAGGAAARRATQPAAPSAAAAAPGQPPAGARAASSLAATTQSQPQSTPEVVTYSPSYTVVPTFECFNACAYCNFRAQRGEPRAAWLSLETARASLEALRDSGVHEILILGGEVHPGSRRRQAWFGLALRICELAVDLGFLPHTNVGPLSREEMRALSAVNASMGLMLEQTSQRLYRARDGPYAKGAPSKDPGLRLAQLDLAGELRIPFTTGVLVGIGETEAELEATLEAIAASHRHFGHVQECIVQPYRPGSRDTWAPGSPYDLDRLPAAVALARAVLPQEVAVQVPPNLVIERPSALRACLAAGARDLGGLSPRDEVNPDYGFPQIADLSAQLTSWGYALAPRLAVHPHLASWAFAGAGLACWSGLGPGPELLRGPLPIDGRCVAGAAPARRSL